MCVHKDVYWTVGRSVLVSGAERRHPDGKHMAIDGRLRTKYTAGVQSPSLFFSVQRADVGDSHNLTLKHVKVNTKTTVEFPFKAAKKTPSGKVTPGIGGEQTAVTTTSDAKADVQIQVLVNECDIPDRTRHSAC